METIEVALDRAGKVLLSHYGNLPSVEKKSEIDLVTVADRQSEACIKAIIQERFPTHRILAEESGADGDAQSEFTWIVDPLDGTTNFSHSFPLFSISIAVERQGEIIAAGVENPFYRERFLAERGCGATLQGKPIRISKTNTLADSLMVTGFPYDRRPKADYYLSIMNGFLQTAQGVLRVGSAALDLCSVACGRLDGFWEEHLQPWDTAAGMLIVQEAGGRITDFSAQPFSPYGKQLLATNGLIHDECLAVLKTRTNPYLPLIP